VTVRHELEALIAGIKESEGATEFVIQGATDKAHAVAALQRGRERAFAVRHPEEPTEPFLPWASGVAETDDGAAFVADTKDATAYPEVTAAVAVAVAAGVAEVPCEGSLVARQKAPERGHVAAVLPGWFPMPPESVREDDQPVMGVGRTVFFKCWTLLSPEELFAFYRGVLEPAGFALEIEHRDAAGPWFHAHIATAVFTRADGTIKVETQIIQPRADASQRDRDRWENDSPYATYTETWVRLNGLADQQCMEWIYPRWSPVSEP
jgi:hypothetical protein